MLIRILLAFFVIAGATSGLLYLATYTDYFNAQRVKRLAINAGLLAAGSLISAIAIAALIALST